MSILSVNNVIASRQQFGGEAISPSHDLMRHPPLFFDNERRAEFSRITTPPMQPSYALYAANVQKQPDNADAAIAGAMIFVGLIGLGILIGGTGGLAVIALGLAACSSLENIGDPVKNMKIERISIGLNGVEANGESRSPHLSADGRFVAFVSGATNLVPGNTNVAWNIFVRDRLKGETERVSVNSDGIQGNDQSYNLSISADGRFVVFLSEAFNLVPEDTNATWDIFVRDRLKGETERVSVNSDGIRDWGSEFPPSINADGRFVTFYSDAPNMGGDGIFVRDRQEGKTERVSSGSSSSISADGNFVAFDSFAFNLVPGDTNDKADIFIRDLKNKKTERVSVDSTGTQVNGDSSAPSISADGNFVAFVSGAANLVPGGTNDMTNVFVYDRLKGETERVSINSDGVQGNSNSYAPSISADGNFVTFYSFASNLVPGDTNDKADIFVRDRLRGKTERVSVDSYGIQGNYGSTSPSISADGHFVAFSSRGTNLVHGDTNNSPDIFVIGPLQ